MSQSDIIQACRLLFRVSLLDTEDMKRRHWCSISVSLWTVTLLIPSPTVKLSYWQRFMFNFNAEILRYQKGKPDWFYSTTINGINALQWKDLSGVCCLIFAWQLQSATWLICDFSLMHSLTGIQIWCKFRINICGNSHQDTLRQFSEHSDLPRPNGHKDTYIYEHMPLIMSHIICINNSAKGRKSPF